MSPPSSHGIGAFIDTFTKPVCPCRPRPRLHFVLIVTYQLHMHVLICISTVTAFSCGLRAMSASPTLESLFSSVTQNHSNHDGARPCHHQSPRRRLPLAVQESGRKEKCVRKKKRAGEEAWAGQRGRYNKRLSHDDSRSQQPRGHGCSCRSLCNMAQRNERMMKCV